MLIVMHECQRGYDDEYARVRATLVRRGSSLNRYLQERGINRLLAYKALKGQSHGKKAREVRAAILIEILSGAA